MKRILSVLFASIGALWGSLATAQPVPIPPNIQSNNNLPMVMLSASRDFTMFWKAYTDFDDIDSDGVIDRTFKASFKYYGYFDPTKCYTYNSGYKPTASGFSQNLGRFEPNRNATKAGTAGQETYYCTGTNGEWSGNFLNWATMSRMDILRKVLYGGLRSEDTADATTLELSFVPRNSQALVKYYNGTDLDQLTPFTTAEYTSKGITLCRRPAENKGLSHSAVLTPEIRVGAGNLALWNMTEIRTCNWQEEVDYSWQTPTIDFVNNNYQTPAGTYGKDNANHAHLSRVPSKPGASGSLSKSFVARVQVCDKNLLGTEKCFEYPRKSGSGKYKPVGLLQEFGESENNGQQPAKAEFALMMGSYDHNLKAGVLRKNMGQINDEINSDGTFSSSASGGIIRSFNEVTIYNYNVETGNFGETCYSEGSGAITDGTCPSWGNPVSELLLESLRFYAGKSSIFGPTDTTPKDDAVGLPKAGTWNDPLKDDPTINSGKKRSALYGQPICRPLNMLTVTSGASSFDDDNLGSFSDIQPSTSYTAAGLTGTIGGKEGISSTMRLVGSNGTTGDNLCTAKTISDFGAVKGVCPDGPNFRGTYLGAGVGYYANTNQIRTEASVGTSLPSDKPKRALMVRNYGVSMSGGIATIAIKLANGNYVYLTPASQDQQGGKTLPGNMVDFKILSAGVDNKTGAALVLWQHNMLGEDQDQDQLQSLRWSLDESTSPAKLKVWSQSVEANTGSGYPMASGYTIVGSSSDGVHFHSGINDYPTTETGLDLSLATVFTDPATHLNLTQCTLDSTAFDHKPRFKESLCVIVDGKYYRGEIAKTYTVTGSTDVRIREPLWYMTKYGGFKYDKNFTSLWPDSSNTAAWDVKRADGKPCGGATEPSCSDGEPDNYFVARSPEMLESSLREILEDIVNSSNTSPAVSSAQLRTDDLKYVARFESSDGHGELSAYKIDDKTGLFKTSSEWNAHEILSDKAGTYINRPVITNNGASGIPFQWASLNDDKKTVLRSGLTGATGDAYGQSLMQWLRGDTSNKSQFRIRASNSVMGPLVNSNPVVELAPAANYFGSDFAGYGKFVTTWAARAPILWVGAGDGMLHAFNAGLKDAGGGAPIMAYIPEPVFANLPNWANASKEPVQSFVDGSPFVGDVMTSSDPLSWATYLFSSLGRGGKGIFALDVTDPAKLTNQAQASNIFKWQFTSADDSDLGYVISEPTLSRFSGQSGQIAKFKNGKFAAIFGNGVMSSNGKAVLYILFAEGPASGNWSGKFVKIVADSGSGNGLSQPIWIDENNDGIVDSIYAGDLKGNLWKFDVSDADSSKWAVAYFGKPLFKAIDTADNALPITSAPEFKFHPSGGQVLVFATGKSYESGDFPNTTRTNAIFGIWDKPSFKTLTASGLDSALPRTLSQLESRTFNNISGSSTDRYITGTVDWSGKLGWYLPFNVSSEMSVSNASIVSSAVAIVSVSPDPTTSPTPCYPTPQARLSVIDALTGMPPSDLLGSTTVDVNGKTVTYWIASIGVSDQKVRISRDAVGTGTTFTNGSCGNGSLVCSRIVGDKTDKGLTGANVKARIFWREIPGLKTNP